ncbi:MAG: DNA polymerase III subunit epsilon [Microbacteriaceae bacterium]|nr:DNA polymerase III subunit epsilon [Microbacteriaceae bacterium]
MVLDFTAIDFETANSSPASACSVGLVKVRGGVVVDTVGWFIRPPAGFDTFAPFNSTIHGIYESDVADAPLWSEQFSELLSFIGDDVLAAHNARFDLGVISAASVASLLAVPTLSYLCSLAIARKTYSLDSYRLPDAALAAGFEDFEHHNAIDDAAACAAIVMHAANRHGAASVQELAELCGVGLKSIGIKSTGTMTIGAAAERARPSARASLR